MTPPRTFHCVMYRDEADMLAVQLEESADRIEQLILVESPVTHRGDLKSLHYLDNADRFAPWKDKITHVIAKDLPTGCDPWITEHAQRDAALAALEGLAEPGDTVVIADVDEFVPESFPQPQPAIAFRQRLAMYAVDWLYPDLHICTVAATWRYVKARGSLASVRDNRYGYPSVAGGWHLTWLGGVEGQRAKLGVHCHLEMRPDEALRISSGRCYERGEHHSGTLMMQPVDVDATWPAAIYEHRCPANWFRPREEACA